MVCGFIYTIENLLNGKKYIGQTLDPDKRKNKHFSGNSLKLSYEFKI